MAGGGCVPAAESVPADDEACARRRTQAWHLRAFSLAGADASELRALAARSARKRPPLDVALPLHNLAARRAA